jgi:hypothetical protein
MAKLHNPGPAVTDKCLDFTQFNVDSRRVRMGLGSNACLSVVERLGARALTTPEEIMPFLLNNKSLKRMTLDCVRKWDERSDTRALEPVEYVPSCLRAAGCLSLRHRSVVLTHPDQARFAHILCADPHPFVIAVTAQLRSEQLRSDAVSNTFVVIAAGGNFALHDSHTGRSIVVHACDMEAAQIMISFVYDSVLPQMSCVGSQLELLICDQGVWIPETGLNIISRLCARTGCQPEFLEAFIKVGRKILARWSCSLADMGDVACTSWEYHRLKVKWASQGHVMPRWFLGSLFFYLHNWRFSDCMHTFATGCLEHTRLWLDQDESSLERSLHNAMPEICRAAHDTFRAVIEVQDPRFLVEKQMVCQDMLSFCGGYRFGPISWPHQHFPFVDVGKSMCKVLGSPLYVNDNFAQIRQDLQDVLTTLPSNRCFCRDQRQICMLTHTLHTLLASEGKAGVSVGFCGGIDNSSMNASMWTCLGSPSPEECMFMFGCRLSPIECGFHISMVGQVVSEFLGDRNAITETALQDLMDALDSLDPNLYVARALSMCGRGETLPSWEDMTWHSPLGKLKLANATRKTIAESLEPGFKQE